MIPEPKPRPCVGCGYCCRKGPCGLAWARGAKPTPANPACPFLVELEGRFRCGVWVQTGEAERKAIADALAFGAGCCSPLGNTDREKMLRRIS